MNQMRTAFEKAGLVTEEDKARLHRQDVIKREQTRKRRRRTQLLQAIRSRMNSAAFKQIEQWLRKQPNEFLQQQLDSLAKVA